MKWVLLLLAVVAVHSKATKKAPIVNKIIYKYDIEREWNNFFNNKNNVPTYKNDPKETTRRKQIFTRNYELINAHNQQYLDNKQTYLMKPALREDLDDDEWWKWKNEEKACALPAVIPSKARRRRAAEPKYKAPESVDWTKGYEQVTSVKHQGLCGSCYIFAAVGVLEGYHKRSTQSLTDISAKHLLDCGCCKETKEKKDKKIENFDCHGGNPKDVLMYAKKSGYSTEASYNKIYDAQKGECRHLKNLKQIPEYESESPITEVKLQEILAKYGPVAVLLNTKIRSFKRYKSGVYTDSECTTPVTHAVLLVGYGQHPRLGKYWLIKNSHGANFGENGYFRLGRDKNLCGITKQAIYIPYP